jgi:hypothetical protein
MKNIDLPYVKKLLADDYHEELDQSYELFQHLAEEQNFTFEFIQLPPVNEGESLVVVLQSIISIFLFVI